MPDTGTRVWSARWDRRGFPPSKKQKTASEGGLSVALMGCDQATLFNFNCDYEIRRPSMRILTFGDKPT